MSSKLTCKSKLATGADLDRAISAQHLSSLGCCSSKSPLLPPITLGGFVEAPKLLWCADNKDDNIDTKLSLATMLYRLQPHLVLEGLAGLTS